jgi:hypothetical protein
MRTYFSVWVVAMAMALVLTPLVARLGRARKLFDYPGVRKVHSTPVPRLGGLAIFVAMLGAMAVVLFVDPGIGGVFRAARVQFLALLAGGTFMLGVGAWDDVRDRRAGPFIHAEIDIGVDGSIEAAARRASLFARLVEEHGLASLGHDPEPEPRTPQPACN